MMTFIQKHWLALTFVVLFVIFFVAALLRIIFPSTKEPIQQENTWNQVTPGYTSNSELPLFLGEPLSTSQTNRGVEYEYPSPTDKPYSTKIEADASGTIQLVKEYPPYDKAHTLDQYTSQFTPADVYLINENTYVTSAPAYIFPDQGLVVFAHISDNVVLEKWYFTPTTLDNFLETWGSELTPPEDHGLYLP